MQASNFGEALTWLYELLSSSAPTKKRAAQQLTMTSKWKLGKVISPGTDFITQQFNQYIETKWENMHKSQLNSPFYYGSLDLGLLSFVNSRSPPKSTCLPYCQPPQDLRSLPCTNTHPYAMQAQIRRHQCLYLSILPSLLMLATFF
jgi:hypothetical protein